MTNREKLMKEYEDALFALLMDEVAQAEGEKALRLNQQLLADPDAAVPGRVQRRCEKTIRNAFAKQSIRRVGHTTKKMIQRVSVAAMLGMLLFTTAFAVSEDFRITTRNTVIQVFDDRTQLTFAGTSTTDRQNERKDDLDYRYNIALDWLPEGYELESGRTRGSSGSSDYIAYVDYSIGSLIEVDFTPYAQGMTYSFDTEDSTKKEIMIQGHPADLYIKNEEALRILSEGTPYQFWSRMIVFWMDDENQVIGLITATNLTEEEMIKLANGVHWGG